MKVVAYSIKPFEKEFLAKANQKKHDITLISNRLNIETAVYAEGKDAIIVFTSDDVSAPVIDKLAKLGIKYIITRSVETDHIDKETAAKYAIKLSNMIITPRLEYNDSGEVQEIADQTIHNPWICGNKINVWEKPAFVQRIAGHFSRNKKFLLYVLIYIICVFRHNRYIRSLFSVTIISCVTFF